MKLSEISIRFWAGIMDVVSAVCGGNPRFETQPADRTRAKIEMKNFTYTFSPPRFVFQKKIDVPVDRTQVIFDGTSQGNGARREVPGTSPGWNAAARTLPVFRADEGERMTFDSTKG